MLYIACTTQIVGKTLDVNFSFTTKLSGISYMSNVSIFVLHFMENRNTKLFKTR